MPIFKNLDLRSSFPASIYTFKVNNGDDAAMREICSKLTKNTPEQHQ